MVANFPSSTHTWFIIITNQVNIPKASESLTHPSVCAPVRGGKGNCWVHLSVDHSSLHVMTQTLRPESGRSDLNCNFG